MSEELTKDTVLSTPPVGIPVNAGTASESAEDGAEPVSEPVADFTSEFPTDADDEGLSEPQPQVTDTDPAE